MRESKVCEDETGHGGDKSSSSDMGPSQAQFEGWDCGRDQATLFSMPGSSLRSPIPSSSSGRAQTAAEEIRRDRGRPDWWEALCGGTTNVLGVSERSITRARNSAPECWRDLIFRSCYR